MRRIFGFLFVILFLFSLAGCAGQRSAENSPEPSGGPQSPIKDTPEPNSEPRRSIEDPPLWNDVKDLYDMAYAYYQANSEHLTAFANAFSETGESQLHIRIYSEDDFNSTASTLPEQLQQPFVDCFSDPVLSEGDSISIDFYNVESFLEHPEFDPKTGFPKEFFEDSPKYDPLHTDLSNLTGIVGEIRLTKDNYPYLELGYLSFYYYENQNDFIKQWYGGSDALDQLLDEHWAISVHIYAYGGL